MPGTPPPRTLPRHFPGAPVPIPPDDDVGRCEPVECPEVEETVIDVITMHVPGSGTISIPGGLLPRQEDERNEAMRRIADALNLPRGLRGPRQEFQVTAWQEPEPSDNVEASMLDGLVAEGGIIRVTDDEGHRQINVGAHAAISIIPAAAAFNPTIDWSTGETLFGSRPADAPRASISVGGEVSGYIARTDGGALDLGVGALDLGVIPPRGQTYYSLWDASQHGNLLAEGVVRGDEIVRGEDVSADGDPEAYEDAPPPDPTTTPIGEGWWENPEGRTIDIVSTVSTMVTSGLEWTAALLVEFEARRRILDSRIAEVTAQRSWLARMEREAQRRRPTPVPDLPAVAVTREGDVSFPRAEAEARQETG